MRKKITIAVRETTCTLSVLLINMHFKHSKTYLKCFTEADIYLKCFMLHLQHGDLCGHMAGYGNVFQAIEDGNCCKSIKEGGT